MINERFKNLIPALSHEEYEILEKNILNEGQREPIVTWNGVIIDGHNRYDICLKNKMTPIIRPTKLKFDNENQVCEWIILNQFGRRNLSTFTRSKLALTLKGFYSEKAKENQGNRTDLTFSRNLQKVDTREEISKIANVSHDTIAKVEKIIKSNDTETINKVELGELSINQGYLIVNKKKEGAGNNFSKNNSKGQRNENDFYQTPWSATEQLLEIENFDFNKTVLEPAKGNGAISNYIAKSFKNVLSYDLSEGKDFLEETNPVDYIITNPPFCLSVEFILKAKEIAKEKFAMLLPLVYLHGNERYYKDVFKGIFPLKKVCVFIRYIMLTNDIREDGKYNTGMQVYAWFIWDKNHKGKPHIEWIDNNKWVL